MTDKLTATLDKAGVRNISTDLWGIFFEDISYSGDGGLNADLVQNGAFEYNRADSSDWSNYSFWRKIVPVGSFAAFDVLTDNPVAEENPHYASVEVEQEPASLENIGWDVGRPEGQPLVNVPVAVPGFLRIFGTCLGGCDV